MTLTAIRQELYGFIDLLPEKSIPAVKSLLKILTEDSSSVVSIETDLTDEEIEMLREDQKRYKLHPEDYVSLKEAKKTIYGS
jgi:hypothetical protein